MQKTLRCLLVSGLVVVGASSKAPVHAVPFPVTSSEAIADSKPIAQVWHYGWGGGAVLAGAAIGLFAGAALASSAYPYGYYGYPYYRAYYPAYYPSWGYRRVYWLPPSVLRSAVLGIPPRLLRGLSASLLASRRLSPRIWSLVVRYRSQPHQGAARWCGSKSAPT